MEIGIEWCSITTKKSLNRIQKLEWNAVKFFKNLESVTKTELECCQITGKLGKKIMSAIWTGIVAIYICNHNISHEILHFT